MNATSPNDKNNSKDSMPGGWVGLIVTIGLAIGLMVLCCWFAPMRVADVHYRAYFVLTHWNDEQALPSGCELCMERFCVRADTKEKYAGGHKLYTSEFSHHYCPEHGASFAWTGSRVDGLITFLYWIITAGVSLLPIPIGMIVCRILLYPLCRLTGRPTFNDEGGVYLFRFMETLDRPRIIEDLLEASIGVFLLLWTCLAWVLFVWF